MTPALPRRSREETARMGQEIFDRVVRPKLTSEDDGKFVAIDVVTEDFEVDVDDYTAVMKLHNRHAAPQVWLMRAGYPAAYKLGLR